MLQEKEISMKILMKNAIGGVSKKVEAYSQLHLRVFRIGPDIMFYVMSLNR